MKFPIRILATFLLISVLSSLAARAATFKNILNQSEGSKKIKLVGDLQSGDHEIFLETLKDLSSGTLILELDSPGGSVQEGEKIISTLLDLKKKTIRLRTEVRNGDQCGSMCLPIFLTGDERSAGKVAAFYFHGVLPHSMCYVPDKDLTETYIQSLIKLGAKEEFIQYLRNNEAFTTPGKFWLSGQELFDLGRGFVSQIEERQDRSSHKCLRWGDRPR